MRHHGTKDENGDPIEPTYDDCACSELAITEQLLPGQHVELVGPFAYEIDNPDFDPEQAESPENPRTIRKEFYRAVNTLGKHGFLPKGLYGFMGLPTQILNPYLSMILQETTGKLGATVIYLPWLDSTACLVTGTDSFFTERII